MAERCRSPSKTCVSAYYYPVPATGLTLGRMVLTLAFECWVFADYLPSSFVRGRLASLTSQLVTALHPIDSVVPLTFALAPSASSTCRLCPGCLLVLMPSGPAATAATIPANELSTTSRKKAIHRLALLGALAITVQIRSLHCRPCSLRVPCVICRSITTEADRLLGQVVRRFYPRRGDEREIGVSVLAEPLRHVLAVPRRRGGQAQPYYRVARLFQPALETPPCCVARVDGTPRTASSVPPAMLRRSCGRAGPAASSETSHPGSDGPDRTARGCRTSSCSGGRPRSNRSRECRQTPRPTCSSAPRRYGGHRCDTRYTTRHGNTRSTSGSLLQRCPVSSTLRISSSGSSSSNSS